jgi:hypothetical protein
VPAQVRYVGVAQEKQKVFRASKRRNPVTGATYPWLVPVTGVAGQYYFYCVDEESGPVCVKFSGYFPYTGRLIINGNEYAQRQAAKADIGLVPLDTAFAAVDDVAAVQAICDGPDEDAIAALAARLLAMLPHPFTAEDIAAGYRYELSVLQAQFSLTPVLDAPVTGRIFFDQLIRDNLGLGRPDRVSLIFDPKIIRKGKRATPAAIAEWAAGCCQDTLAILSGRRDPWTRRIRPPGTRTFSRVFARIDAEAFNAALYGYLAARPASPPAALPAVTRREREQRRAAAAAARPDPPGLLEQAAADGKTVRGAVRPDGSQVHLLSVVPLLSAARSGL